MRRLIASAVLASAVVGGASLAHAQEPPGCDSYSGACPSETATSTVSPVVSPNKLVKPRPGVLSVTGGEIVLLLTIGGAAVAGGTVLVAAGRNKKHAA